MNASAAQRRADALMFKYADGYVSTVAPDGSFSSAAINYPDWWLTAVNYTGGPPPVPPADDPDPPAATLQCSPDPPRCLRTSVMSGSLFPVAKRATRSSSSFWARHRIGATVPIPAY